ncbi:hypothetical protein [Hymenobacter sp. UYP22]|uniref:hypothetical protein n=1 Tax=Hymenobacter sp. UYP22 TaxID=3156348 RepID=UPI00339592F7
MSSAVFTQLLRLGRLAYWYCVDFMVNLANLSGTSYPEANTWVLLLLIPGLLALLLLVRLWQRRRLLRLRRQIPLISIS